MVSLLRFRWTPRINQDRHCRRKPGRKKTVVLVSHEQAAIRELCDGVLWIEQGREQDMGPVEDVIPAYLKAMTLKP